MSTFCQRLLGRKCQWRGVGGQKRQKLVNVICELLSEKLDPYV